MTEKCINQRVAVTGATGFVGAEVCRQLEKCGATVVRVVRGRYVPLGSPEMVFPVGNIGPTTQWADALANVDTVVHCAGQASISPNDDKNGYQALRTINLDGARRLGEEAALAGVKRLIFISTVKVHGESSLPGGRFAVDVEPGLREVLRHTPEDQYARSKWQAEKTLWEVSARTGLELVVVRPPMVYGPGVKGNFLSLLKLVNMRIPLPFGSIDNRRSMVALPNLVNFVVQCSTSCAAPGHTFLVSDDEDLSTSELLQLIARSMGRRAMLFPAPSSLMRILGRLTGQEERIERLFGSLQVDITNTRRIMGWRPPVSVESGVKDTVRWFQAQL